MNWDSNKIAKFFQCLMDLYFVAKFRKNKANSANMQGRRETHLFSLRILDKERFNVSRSVIQRMTNWSDYAINVRKNTKYREMQGGNY